MRDATLSATLVINRSYEPLSFCSTRRALILYVNGKADIIEDRGREIHDGIPFPSVIRLVEQAKVPHKSQTLSRKNILLRDRNTCMYCGVVQHAGELTLDHVLPRAQGGRDKWENLVACCKKCNRFKADRTPEQAGMKLIHKPRPSTMHTSRFILRSMGAEQESWKKYLYYDSDGHKGLVTYN